ncbi:unnamed protein product, partial [Chrysoparadoxa australica]
LLFWVPNPTQPVPVFKDIAAAWVNGEVPIQVAIAVAMAGIAIFAFLNIKSLIWNLQSFSAFRKTPAYAALRTSNAESTLLAMPLALAMTVNVGFILGMVFVPQLWSVVEYLFPLAMVAFALIAVMAFRLIGVFLGRVLAKGGLFDVTAHNSNAQLTPAFAVSMEAVAFSAPVALSTNP